MQTFTRVFQVTLAAGIIPAAPLVTTCQLPQCVVEHISWLFPSGCNGLVGIQIGTRKVPILPYDVTQFMVDSGGSSSTDVTDMHETGDWSVIGYNLGSVPHTVSVTFKYHIPRPPEKQYFILDDIAGLIGAGES